MGILAWIILGGLAGWIASMIMSTNEDQGIFLNIIVGIIGAVLGGFIVQMLGGSGIDGFNLYSLIVAVFGAIALLAVVKTVRRS